MVATSRYGASTNVSRSFGSMKTTQDLQSQSCIRSFQHAVTMKHHKCKADRLSCCSLLDVDSSLDWSYVSNPLLVFDKDANLLVSISTQQDPGTR
mmetsp:Transcript_57457/g.168235  ORF Transcript_57457/g.168235 Transcript_57457/m.168235 type:complete len:95 (-) Transcript_57457:1997-2281(-)